MNRDWGLLFVWFVSLLLFASVSLATVHLCCKTLDKAVDALAAESRVRTVVVERSDERAKSEGEGYDSLPVFSVGPENLLLKKGEEK